MLDEKNPLDIFPGRKHKLEYSGNFMFDFSNIPIDSLLDGPNVTT